MVFIRFKIFVYAIIFMLLHFVASSLQDTDEKMVGIAKDKIIKEGLILSQQEKDMINVLRVNDEVVVKHTIIGGRKMKNLNEEQINVDEVASSSSTNINARNGGQKMARKTKKIHHQQHHDPNSDHELVKISSSFMALNAADYHVPRSHPPRNN